MEVVSIPLTHIFTRKGSRPIVEKTVNGLVDSIREIGLLNPLRVRPARRFVMGVEADAYEVIVGGHRLSALRKLEFYEADCVVVNDDDMRMELAEIDENLMRAELSPADRAAQTARRKAIYLELHPETAAAHNASRERKTAGNLSFVSATADAIGKDGRTVRRDAERGEKISEQALSLVRQTDLDKGVYLDKLKKIDPEKQAARVLSDLENAEKRKEMEKRNKDANRVIEMTDAQRFAEWILERADLQELDVVIGWLQGTKAKDVISALRREAA